jgi:hypothetical protein
MGLIVLVSGDVQQRSFEDQLIVVTSKRAYSAVEPCDTWKETLAWFVLQPFTVMAYVHQNRAKRLENLGSS